MVAACSYGSTPLGLFTVLIPCVTMFFSSWEQYHTGTLYLGYFNGPCEGIIIACTLMSISAIYGPGFYHQTVGDVVRWEIFKGSQVMVYELFVGMCFFAFFVVHMPSWYVSLQTHPTQHKSIRGIRFDLELMLTVVCGMSTKQDGRRDYHSGEHCLT